MQKNLKQIIKHSKVVSFDVFDTLLLRNVPHPQDIFTIIEEKHQIYNFKKKRIQAEIQARKTNFYNEITLNEIYQFLPNIDMAYEIEVEKESLFLNLEIYDLYQYAKDLNKTIIVISDMYLDKETLSQILHKNHLDAIEKIYVSSEYRLTKKEGALYERVLQDLNIKNPNNVLHIGDNTLSDVIMAKEKGINSIHYQKKLIKNCSYKHFIMKQDVNSLKKAQAISLDNLKINIEVTPLCYFKWLTFLLKQTYNKCIIFGISSCIKKIFTRAHL